MPQWTILISKFFKKSVPIPRFDLILQLSDPFIEVIKPFVLHLLENITSVASTEARIGFL